LLEGLCLFVRSALVDDDSYLPVPRTEIRGKQVVEREVDAAEIDAVEIPLPDRKDR
jgi:hypothetical protein